MQPDNGRNLNKDNGLQTRWTRTPAHNRRLAAMAGDVVN